MTRAFVEREAPPAVAVAPCLGCGTVGEERLCDACADRCAEAAEHTTACGCADCGLYRRVVAAGEVSL